MASKVNRVRRWFNVLFPLACFYVFAYPWLRLAQWYELHASFGLVEVMVVWLLGTVGLWYSFRGPNMIIRYIVVHWMGASFILSTLTVVAEGVRLVLPIDDRSLVQGVLATGLILVILAIAISHHLTVKHQVIPSKKISRRYRIAQISDVHIGSRQGGFMRRIVNKLNALEPDFVVITGDLVDSSSVDYEALAALENLNAKTYFSIGNHERYADLPKILDMMTRLGITTLRQTMAREGELSFIGIDDSDHRNQVAKMLPLIETEEDSYQILLYHRPVGWTSALQNGIDLMLSGHTHNGQIFPFNLLVKQQFKRIRGLFVEDRGRLYVSSGTGTWGPLMRLGSMNEIALFDLQPES